MKTRIQLSDHFTYRRLLRFTLPSIVMMIVASVYSVVDGLFVSNIVGDNALASINIVMPLCMGIGAFGFMLGTGGSAEVAKTLGEGNPERASAYFSMLIGTIVAVGLVLSAICIAAIRPLCRLLGASDLLMDDCIGYGIIMLAGSTAFMLQTSFQSFFVVAEKPHMGLALSVASGLTNAALDFLFIYVFRWGVRGAALATVCGYLVGGIIPLIYFLRPNSSLLRLGKVRLYPRVLLHSCTNGSSEMMTNLSSSLISMLYNLQLMRLVGETGVAALSVMMYVNFVFLACFIGFAIGSAPVISYHYGAQNQAELKSVFRKSLTIIGTLSISMLLLAQLLARPIAAFFVGYSPALMEMTVRGFRIFAVSFLFCGLNIFGSAFFTALCNGKISALISFLRALVLQGGMILLLPLLFRLNGVWAAVVAAEALAVLITVFFFVQQRKKYHYA